MNQKKQKQLVRNAESKKNGRPQTSPKCGWTSVWQQLGGLLV